jgi:hypothetical protein
LQDSEKNGKEEDEDDSFDYEDRVFAVMKAKVLKLDIHENLTFNHEKPGILEVCWFVSPIHIISRIRIAFFFSGYHDLETGCYYGRNTYESGYTFPA